MMGTGLKRDIGRGAARQIAGPCQRFGLGMGPPTCLCPAAPDNPWRLACVLAHNKTANRRIGRNLPQTTRSEVQSQFHEARIVRSDHFALVRRPRERLVRSSEILVLVINRLDGTAQLLEELLEILRLPEIPVNRGKPDIGDGIQ